MENRHRISTIMGITPEQYKKYNREYMRQNPHDLPELRRIPRPRIAVRNIPPTLVFSTRGIA